MYLPEGIYKTKQTKSPFAVSSRNYLEASFLPKGLDSVGQAHRPKYRYLLLEDEAFYSYIILMVDEPIALIQVIVMILF